MGDTIPGIVLVGKRRYTVGVEAICARTYEAVPAIPCDRTIPASIYNGRLLIARWLIALRSSCRELIPGRDILTAWDANCAISRRIAQA